MMKVSTSEGTQESQIVSLVKQAQGGDQDAYAELFNEFHQPVLSYIYHTLHDQQAAEDVAQEAFIRAHQRLAQLGPPWDFKSWVFRIASNLAMDYLRGGKRMVDVEDDVMVYLEDPPSTRRPFERQLQREEQRHQVWDSLEGLPARYRQALVLREVNELSYQEVATALEVSYDNARQLVHRARGLFRDVHGLRMTVAEAAVRCKQLGDLLSAYSDNELDPAQSDQVAEHLASCRDCQQEQEEFKKVGALLAGLFPLVPSPAWKSKVLEEIQAKQMPAKAAPTIQGNQPAPQPPAAPAAVSPAASAGGGLAAMMGGGWPLMLLLGAGGLLLLALGGWMLFVGGGPPGAPPPSETAQVLAPAAGETGSATDNELGALPVGASATPTRTPSATPTASATATLGPAMATVLENSVCRGGPSATDYEPVIYLTPGQILPIDGRNAPDTYWRVVSAAGRCYLWQEQAEESGDVDSVPIVPDPPTPTPEDSQSPQISASHAPTGSNRPNTGDLVSFQANATDNVGVARIEVWVQGPADNTFQLAKTCTNSSVCSHQGGPYSIGQVRYYALAVDAAGNQTQTTTRSFTVYPILF